MGVLPYRLMVLDDEVQVAGRVRWGGGTTSRPGFGRLRVQNLNFDLAARCWVVLVEVLRHQLCEMH
jgi:hypothetical protein